MLAIPAGTKPQGPPYPLVIGLDFKFAAATRLLPILSGKKGIVETSAIPGQPPIAGIQTAPDWGASDSDPGNGPASSDMSKVHKPRLKLVQSFAQAVAPWHNRGSDGCCHGGSFSIESLQLRRLGLQADQYLFGIWIIHVGVVGIDKGCADQLQFLCRGSIVKAPNNH